MVPAAAQVDSALAYYPLNIGYVWQYHVRYTSSQGSVSYYYLVRVVADTLMSNGIWYKHLDYAADDPLDYPYIAYRRVDSSTACVYRYQEGAIPAEILLDSLCAKERDLFGDFILVTCLRVDTSTIFGVQTGIKDFQYSIVPGTPVMTFARGFGLVHRTELYAWSEPAYTIYTDLQYARINGQEYGTLVTVQQSKPELPRRFSLAQNYPNPFNPTTVVSYQLPVGSNVRLVIFDILGREVATLVNERKAPGSYSVKFDGSHLASGVYFYRIVAGSFAETKRLLLIR